MFMPCGATVGDNWAGVNAWNTNNAKETKYTKHEVREATAPIERTRREDLAEERTAKLANNAHFP